MVRYGIDGLILEGSEAGGHIGPVTLMILLQQVMFKITDVPIFVAGGIATGRMIAHLLLMGASGVQMGTRFVMTDECTASPKFKEAFIRAEARHAIATPQFDSRLPVVPVRALKNKATDEFGKLQIELLTKLEKEEITREEAQFAVENFWIGGLRKAVVDGDTEAGSMMAGQSVGLMKSVQPMKDVIHQLVNDAEWELGKIKAMVSEL
jgi:enoyl-[acyl-carrier protein] reductase II